MAAPKTYRWRKTTDINREHALFELLDGEHALLNVGFTDQGIFEISFNSNIGGMVIEWEQLMSLVGEGRSLAERDR